jgi:hypothetical protein
VDGVPDDLGPFLRDIGEAYLPYLCSNAEAFVEGESRHDAEIQGIRSGGFRTWAHAAIPTKAFPSKDAKCTKTSGNGVDVDLALDDYT